MSSLQWWFHQQRSDWSEISEWLTCRYCEISHRRTWIVLRENAFCKFHTFFGFKKLNKLYRCPRTMHFHSEIYPNLKSILFKMNMKSLDTFILASRENWVSCNQILGCLHLYGDSRFSRAQSRINAYEILLQHDWLGFYLWGFFCIMFWNKRFLLYLFR